jgi:hypothetical protein
MSGVNHIFADQFYTSHTLAITLSKVRCYHIGTVMNNMNDVTAVMKKPMVEKGSVS